MVFCSTGQEKSPIILKSCAFSKVGATPLGVLDPPLNSNWILLQWIIYSMIMEKNKTPSKFSRINCYRKKCCDRQSFQIENPSLIVNNGIIERSGRKKFDLTLFPHFRYTFTTWIWIKKLHAYELYSDATSSCSKFVFARTRKYCNGFDKMSVVVICS